MTREEAHKELLSSDTEYCYYCGTPKSSYGCCGENHFGKYSDLYAEDQQYLINELLEEVNNGK